MKSTKLCWLVSSRAICLCKRAWSKTSVRACPCCVKGRIQIPQHTGEPDTNPVPVTRAPSWVHVHWAAWSLCANSYLYLLSFETWEGFSNDGSKICWSTGEMPNVKPLLANSETLNVNKATVQAPLPERDKLIGFFFFKIQGKLIKENSSIYIYIYKNWQKLFIHYV